MRTKATISESSNRAVIFSVLLTLVGCAYPIAGKQNRYEHVKRTSLEIYTEEVAEAEKRGSPIIVTKVNTSSPNSAGGVDVYLDFLSISKIGIKYAKFEVAAFNAVKDRVSSTIGGKSIAKLNATGPYYRGSTNSGKYWENIWYNHSITCAEIQSAEIILMDGTTKKYPREKLANILSSGYVNNCGGTYFKSSLNEPLPSE